MQAGSKALEDIGSGNVQAVEQDLSGTSGSTAGLQQQDQLRQMLGGSKIE
jgi:hypothetical protein